MKALILFALAAMVPAFAFARSGTLHTITIGFPDGASTSAVKKVRSCLAQDFSFVRGEYFSISTFQSFSGPTEDLNKLIQLLQASQLELKVGFSDLKDDEISFVLSQNQAAPRKIEITVNTTRKDIRWSELKIQTKSKGDVEQQDGADQPATAPESKSEGSEKPKPESEEHSQ